jgi:hypothetical protein
MSDLKKQVQGEKEALRSADEAGEEGRQASRTAGTNRDLDETGESKNQGHGHPRDQRGGSDEAGHSERTVTDRDRAERDLGGPGD